jgi:L-fuconolactonase
MTRTDPAQGAESTPFHPPADLQWLRQTTEEALEPALAIVDAHHHLFDRPTWRYPMASLRADLAGGHRVVATVYVECRESYRTDGPEPLRPVGETEAVERIAVQAANDPGAPRACAAIVAHADLTLGPAVDAVLHAHRAASPARLRGIRQTASADADPAYARVGARPVPGLLRTPEFRAGFARLAPHGLSFDAWLYHPQLPDLIDLARAFPDTTIVLDHVGGPLGLGRYAGQRDAVFAAWRASILALASCPNVVVKLGGLGMRLCGFGFHEQPRPPTSQALAAAWRPYVETCIEAFGPARCMFESNFPVDQVSCDYGVLWNAFKRIASGCSPAQKAELFAGTAARIYRLDLAD